MDALAASERKLRAIAPATLAITSIRIPLALANLNPVPVSLLPLGRTVVPVEQAAATGATFSEALTCAPDARATRL